MRTHTHTANNRMTAQKDARHGLALFSFSVGCFFAASELRRGFVGGFFVCLFIVFLTLLVIFYSFAIF